jgi:hypothetical protein
MLIAELLLGWCKANEARTFAELGDRFSYVGMSDIGKAFGCFRQAVLGKVKGCSPYPSQRDINAMKPEEWATALERIRPLERGHEQEVGIASALSAVGCNFVQQLEIQVEHEGVPIRAHLDFTIFTSSGVKVVESKSNEEIPKTLYPEYEGQLYGQIGLMDRFWHEPVFSIPEPNAVGYKLENLSMPDLAKSLFGEGVQIPYRISGQILSMNGTETVTFGTYYPKDFITDLVLSKGKAVWEKAQECRNGLIHANELDYKYGFHPLCDYCEYASDCPKFAGGSIDGDHEAVTTLLQLEEVKKEKAELEKRMKALKKALVQTYETRGLSGKEWISSDYGRFRNAERSRKSLNQAALAEKLQEWGFSEDEVNDLISECTNESTFKVLDTSIPK